MSVDRAPNRSIPIPESGWTANDDAKNIPNNVAATLGERSLTSVRNVG